MRKITLELDDVIAEQIEQEYGTPLRDVLHVLMTEWITRRDDWPLDRPINPAQFVMAADNDFRFIPPSLRERLVGRYRRWRARKQGV